MDAQPPKRTDDDSDPLEDLLMEALGLLETDGPDAVERLLLAHPEEAPRVRSALKDLDTADLLEQPPSQLPDRFGDFSIKETLGAGGMGVVFLAQQDSLQREVALKVIRPELLLFEGSRERFQREIDAVARLEHPAIVPILATGIADDIPYYAMPRLRGKNGEAVVAALAERDPSTLTGEDLRLALGDVDSESISDIDGTFAGSYWQAIVRLIRKAALGIHHAHARGVMHRDIKPSNIVFTPTGQAIVLDFGLAQARGDARLTQAGTAAGSPAYMAPEQIRGEPSDERSDVYNLAATLYCLLGLRPPYPTNNSEILRARILAGERQELPRGSSLPPELLVVLDCALDIDRVRRFESAKAFANDLQAVLDGRPILARRLPLRVRIRRYAQSHRAITSALAVAAVFLVLLPTALLYQERRASEELGKQVSKTERANSALQTANKALQRQVERSDRSVQVSLDAVDSLLVRLAHDKLRMVPATLRVAEGVLEEALKLYDKLENEEKYRVAVQTSRFNALKHLVGLQDTLGQLEHAERTANEALRLLNDTFPIGAPAPDNIRFARADMFRAIAGLHIKQNSFEKAQQLVDAAREDYEATRKLPEHAPGAIAGLGMLASLQASLDLTRRNATAAEASMKLAVTFTRKAEELGQRSPAHMVARLNLSKLYRQMRRHKDSLRLADGVLAELDVAPEVNTGWPISRMLKAMAEVSRFRNMQQLDRQQQALEEHQKAIATLTDVIDDYPNASDARTLRAATNGNLARTLLRVAPDRALRLVDSAIDDLHFVLDAFPDDVDAGRFLINQLKTCAYVLRRKSNWQRLEVVALELGRREAPGTHRETAARDLIRCAMQSPDQKRRELLEQAMQFLLASRRSGADVLVNDDLYAPLRSDPRFAELSK